MSTHSKKIKFNLISVVLCQIVTIGIGFILPRIYIENFGSSVNGVLSTIKQIFTYLCLLEAGVGLATTQALFGPVAKSDHDRINSILAATRRYYNNIGLIYGGAVTVFALLYGFVINTGTIKRRSLSCHLFYRGQIRDYARNRRIAVCYNKLPDIFADNQRAFKDGGIAAYKQFDTYADFVLFSVGCSAFICYDLCQKAL